MGVRTFSITDLEQNSQFKMKLSVWITIWVFSLFYGLLANPTYPPLAQLMKAINYDNLLQNVKCPKDSTFYTPRNVPECITAALGCSFLEFSKVVKHECKDLSGEMSSALETFEIIIKVIKLKADNVKKDRNDCACEQWPETPFDKFLMNIKELFEMYNSLQHRTA